jgi:hypothetical protein
VIFPYAFLSFWFRKWLGSARRGKFVQGEISVRSLELSHLWATRWGLIQPIGHRLREAFPDRWVRFHAVPKGGGFWLKKTERQETLRRHHTVLAELCRISGDTNFLVLGEDWGWNDLHAGWVARTIPESWPWRICVDESEPDSPPSFLWVSPELSTLDELNGVLLSAAKDEAMAIITDEGLNWLYWPYSGGADVVAPTTAWRDTLSGTIEL